jgi:hypothetical protein
MKQVVMKMFEYCNLKSNELVLTNECFEKKENNI